MFDHIIDVEKKKRLLDCVWRKKGGRGEVGGLAYG